MFKVLHVHTMPIISGSGINTFITMDGVNKTLFQSALACAPGGPLIDLVKKHGMEVALFKNLVQPMAPVKDILSLISLTSYLKRNPFHIVHTHNSKAGFTGRLAAKLAGIPITIHTVHGFSFHDEEPLWRRLIFKNLERVAASWCDRMIFISQPLIDWAKKEKIGNPDRFLKIYSGIQLDRFCPVENDKKNRAREKWGILPDDKVIGIVSKLWEGKGHEVLIDAFALLKKDAKNAKLAIVGEGYLLDRLQSRVREAGIKDSVIFTGFLEDVSEITSTLDVAVLPSYFEGMGRVLLEAMAMGKPVVGSNVGGIPDLIENGANGFLAAPGDVQGFAKAINNILNDEKLASQMGSKGREKVTSLFSSEQMAQSIETLYIKLLKDKGFPIAV